MSRLRLGRIVDFEKWARDSINSIAEALGKISPSENFTQSVFRGTGPGANVEFTLTHNLGKGPPRQDANGNWLPGVEFTYWLNGAGTLYESDYANWTDNAIKLKCTDAGRGYTVIVR